MTPAVSAIVVNHRSAEECAECVASLRAAFAAEGIAGEIVLVDCASGPAEVDRLSALRAEAFVPLPENRGYSGGLNAGLSRARAPRILFVNADVALLPGALSALLDAVEPASVGAAAPLAFWDAESRLRLPAGDPPRFLSEIARGFPGPAAASERRFASLARKTLHLWQSGGSARHLVGALLATRRDVLDRVGRFDERFPFEYEETEWEERVLRAGLELRFTPRARVRHRWAVSSSRNPETAGRRDASRRFYRELRWGRAGRRLLEWADARPAALPPSRPVAVPEAPARPGTWVALSPNPSCFPFVGTPLSVDFRLPEEIERALPRGTWYLRVFRESDGQPLETLRWEAA